MEERRFLRREWLVINHSVSLDVTLSLRAAQETIPESKNRAYPSPLLCKKLETYKPAKNLPFTRAQSSSGLRGRRVSHNRNRKHRPRGGGGGGGERGGVPKRAEEGETHARKRPSSLKYVPAGGNYAFNYLNE